MLPLDELYPINTIEKIDNLLDLLEKRYTNTLNSKELDKIEIEILFKIRKIKLQIYFKEKFSKKILAKSNINTIEAPKSKRANPMDYKPKDTYVNPRVFKFINKLDAFNNNPILDHNLINRYEKAQLEYFRLMRNKKLSREDCVKIRSKFETYTKIIRYHIKSNNEEPTLKQRVEEIKVQKNTMPDSTYLTKKAVKILPTDTTEDPIHRK